MLNVLSRLVDAGKSGLARATLRKASEALRQQEEERRERYVAEVTALGNGERDIAAFRLSRMPRPSRLICPNVGTDLLDG